MKLLFFYFMLFLSGIFNIRAQSYTEPSKQKLAGITVNQPDQTIKTQMLNRQPKSAADNSKTYMWYSKQKIMETKGGFDGKLIHGRYAVFYLNNQLKEKAKCATPIPVLIYCIREYQFIKVYDFFFDVSH